VIKKEAENIPKYKVPTIGIQCMWNVTTKIIPVVIGTTGTISRLFLYYLSNMPGKHKIRNYKKQPYWALHTHTHTLTSESANVTVQNI